LSYPYVFDIYDCLYLYAHEMVQIHILHNSKFTKMQSHNDLSDCFFPHSHKGCGIFAIFAVKSLPHIISANTPSGFYGI